MIAINFFTFKKVTQFKSYLFLSSLIILFVHISDIIPLPNLLSINIPPLAFASKWVLLNPLNHSHLTPLVSPFSGHQASMGPGTSLFKLIYYYPPTSLTFVSYYGHMHFPVSRCTFKMNVPGGWIIH